MQLLKDRIPHIVDSNCAIRIFILALFPESTGYVAGSEGHMLAWELGSAGLLYLSRFRKIL